MLDEAFLDAILIANVNPMDKITILYDHHCTACDGQCKAIDSFEIEDAIVVTWECPKCTLREDAVYKEAQ